MGYTHRQFDDITLLVIHYRGNKIIPYSGTEIPTQNLAEWNWNETAKTALGKL
jgi:hypothetical protein